jgi:hypothetical protein
MWAARECCGQCSSVRDPGRQCLGAVIDRAEAMRYLAEMPWAPDAVLGNPEVTWADLGEGRYEAALDTPSGRVAVTFTLDAAGDIAEMTALRPDAGPDGAEILREWRGRYWGYDRVGGRRIPVEAEVGYVDAWPTRDSSICVCTPSIRCWKARCG